VVGNAVFMQVVFAVVTLWFMVCHSENGLRADTELWMLINKNPREGVACQPIVFICSKTSLNVHYTTSIYLQMAWLQGGLIVHRGA
jgi:hypothetical protein